MDARAEAVRGTTEDGRVGAGAGDHRGDADAAQRIPPSGCSDGDRCVIAADLDGGKRIQERCAVEGRHPPIADEARHVLLVGQAA